MDKNKSVIARSPSIPQDIRAEAISKDVIASPSARNYLPELPNWIHITLENIAGNESHSIKRGPFGSAIKKEYFVPSGYKVYEQKNVIYNDFDLGNYYIDEKKFNELKSFSIKPGDILITCSGTVGKIAVVPQNIKEGIINQALLKITPNYHILNIRYFVNLFKFKVDEIIISNTRGSAMLNISSVEDLKRIKFPLPPLPEQNRIVARIEELFTKLDAGVEALKKVKAQLKRYRQAVLKYAFEGKLTEEWRETHKNELEPASVLLERVLKERRVKWEVEQLEKMKGKGKIPKNESWKKRYIEPLGPAKEELPELPSGWSWTNFDQLAEAISNAIKAGPFGSSLKKEFYVSSGYKIYGQEQVIRSNPLYGDYYIDEKRYEQLKSCAVKPGDILISLVGTIGKVLVLPEEIEPGIINPRLVKVSLDRRLLNPRYIKAYIESSNVSYFFSLASHGGTMDILNLSILKELPIPVPSLPEQHKIVEEIERRFSVADKIETVVEESLKQAERLRQSILKKAFEGKLVPQDSSDEPAEKLLERIKLGKKRGRD